MVLDRFIDTFLAQKGYSVHTSRAYRSDILGFIRFVLTDESSSGPLPGIVSTPGKHS